MGERIRITDSEKLSLLYERFRDVCLVEKEIWKEIFMPRDIGQGPVRTNIQDRYEVEIDDPEIERPPCGRPSRNIASTSGSTECVDVR
jgi:hypothetical protein